VAELIGALATGLLWVTACGLVMLCVRLWSGLTPGTAVLAGYPLFCAAQVLLARLLARLGVLNATAMIVGTAAAVVLMAAAAFSRHRRHSAVPAPTQTDADTAGIRRIALLTISVVFAALALFTLLAPIHIWDALAYHLPMIASYVQNGSLDAWPTQDLRQIYRVNAAELQMLNVALLARSDAWIELPNLIGLGVVLVATFELARLATPRHALAWLATLLVLTAPQIVIGAASEKNDLIFTAMLLCAFYWIIRVAAAREARTGHYILLAALSGALAGATKVMGLNVAGAAGLLMLVLTLRRKLRFGQVVTYAVAALVALLLLAGNVYLGNLTRSAVPVGVAPGEVNFTIGIANLVTAAQFYVYDLTFRRLITLPAIEHDFLHYGYLFPIMLVLGVAAGVQQLRERNVVGTSLALLTATLVLSVIAVRVPIQWDQRFMIWLVPALGVLALTRLERLRSDRLRLITWLALVLAFVNAGAALTLESDRLVPRSARHLLSTGQLARYVDVPNRRYPDMVDGFAALDRAAGAADSVLYVGSDDSWMYAAWGPRFSRRVEGVWNADHADAQVAGRRFRFVIIEDAARPDIRRAAAERAAASGYEVLVDADGRTVLTRRTADD
jgi:hypothetical protein